MNHPFRLYAAVAAVSLASLSSTPALPAKTDLDNVCVSVGRLLEEGHYTHKQLNDDLSGKVLRSYLELLDFSHLFFTQEDVNSLTEKYGPALDDDILLGNLKPAYEIYDLYQTERLIFGGKKARGRKTRPKPTSSGVAESRASFCRNI